MSLVPLDKLFTNFQITGSVFENLKVYGKVLCVPHPREAAGKVQENVS
jgi:hypothetical protein